MPGVKELKTHWILNSLRNVWLPSPGVGMGRDPQLNRHKITKNVYVYIRNRLRAACRSRAGNRQKAQRCPGRTAAKFPRICKTAWNPSKPLKTSFSALWSRYRQHSSGTQGTSMLMLRLWPEYINSCLAVVFELNKVWLMLHFNLAKVCCPLHYQMPVESVDMIKMIFVYQQVYSSQPFCCVRRRVSV